MLTFVIITDDWLLLAAFINTFPTKKNEENIFKVINSIET